MNNEDSLEKLKKRLYKSGEQSLKKRYRRIRLPLRKKELPRSWQIKEEDLTSFKKPKPSILKPIIVLAALVGIAGVTAFLVFWQGGGGNVVSSRNIDLVIQGPQEVKGGEPASWRVNVVNKNKVALEAADLIIEYPQGAVPAKRLLPSPLRQKIDFGRINPQESVFEDFGATFFGQENSELELKAVLEYRPENSSAIFAKTASFQVQLTRSPVSLSVSAPSEIHAGQEVEIKAHYSSNSDQVVKDLVLMMEYPSGFSFQEASFEPVKGDNLWQIGDLESTAEGELMVEGVLEGQDQEEKHIRVLLGILDEQGDFLPYYLDVASIVLKKDFLDIDILVDSGEEKVLSLGESFNVGLSWRNNLPVAVRNAVLEVSLEGRAVDKSSIFANQGFFRSLDNVIIWTPSTLEDFSLIEPGEQGVARFGFSLIDSLAGQTADDKNLTVKVSAKMSVPQSPAGFENFNIKGENEKVIKIGTSFQLASRALYYSGALENAGPLPPKLDQETSYTVVWSLTNSLNDLADVLIRASLPPYVKWADEFLPSEEDLSYNSATGEVVWRVGLVPAGTGAFQPAKEASFKIILTPAINQVGQKVILLSETTAEGKDVFTDLNLRQSRPALNTELKNDPQFQAGQGVVSQ